jgi:Spy/CpxP family protein refolding chaperone
MTLRNLFASGLFVAGLAAAQSIPANPTATNPGNGSQWQHRGSGQMFSQLQLTDAQKTQAQQIFQALHANSQTLETQLQGIHQQLANAVKGGAPDAQIDQLSNQAGTVMGQLMAMRTKAFAKFYAILTPDQKAKADAMGDRFPMMGMREMGRGPGPGQQQ